MEIEFEERGSSIRADAMNTIAFTNLPTDISFKIKVRFNITSADFVLMPADVVLKTTMKCRITSSL